MARQFIEINWKLLDTMIEAQCPIEEICERLEIHEQTLYRRIKAEKNTNYDNYVRKFHSTGKSNVRLMQYNKAMSGNVQMLIRWGELHLDQGSQNLEKQKSNTDLENEIMELKAKLKKHDTIHNERQTELELPGSDTPL